MATETPPAPPPPKPEPPKADPFIARLLDDMGKVLEGDTLKDAPPKAPETPRNVLDNEFISMGEAARFKKEREQAKPPEPKPEDKPPEQNPPEVKKEGDKPSETPPAATPPPAPKKVEVVKTKPLEEIIEGVVRKVTKPTETPPTPPPEEKPAPKQDDADKAYIEGLDEDQQEALALAEYASKAMPDRYGNMPKRMVDYLKKVDAYIEDKRKEDPEWDGENDASFKAWIEENQPTYQPGDKRKLERRQIRDEVRTEVEKDLKPKIEETEQATRAQNLKPEIDKAVTSYQDTVAQRLAPDDKSPFHAVIKAVADAKFTEDGWKAAGAVDKLATAYAKSFLDQANTLAREYLELASGASRQVPYNQTMPPDDPQNERAMRQLRLFRFIDTQEKVFADQGGDMRVVNGKTFATRAEMAKMTPAEQAKHWTLGHPDVLDMLAIAAAEHAQASLKAEVKRREEEGYTRNGKTAEPKKEETPLATTPKKDESPRATTTPAPGAASPPPPPSSPTLFTEEILKKQWEGGPAIWKG